MAIFYSNVVELVVTSGDYYFEAHTAPSHRNANLKDEVVARCVVEGGTAPFSYQLYKDGSPLAGETDPIYIIDSMQASDEAVYYWDVTDAVKTIQTNNFTLDLYESPSHNNSVITFGGVEYPMQIRPSIKTVYELGMLSTVDSMGLITWRDKGVGYDHCTSSIKFSIDDIISNQRKAFQEWVVGSQWSSSSVLFRVDSGIYPMSPLYDMTSDTALGIRDFKIEKSSDQLSRWDSYAVTIEPVELSTLPINTSVDSCPTPATWDIMGVSLPEPVFSCDLQSIFANRQLMTGIDSYNKPINHTAEITKVKATCDFDKARELLSAIIANRVSTFIANVPNPYLPFGSQYDDVTSFTCSLASNSVILTQRDYDDITIEFVIQKRV